MARCLTACHPFLNLLCMLGETTIVSGVWVVSAMGVWGAPCTYVDSWFSSRNACFGHASRQRCEGRLDGETSCLHYRNVNLTKTSVIKKWPRVGTKSIYIGRRTLVENVNRAIPQSKQELVHDVYQTIIARGAQATVLDVDGHQVSVLGGNS